MIDLKSRDPIEVIAESKANAKATWPAVFRPKVSFKIARDLVD